MNVRPKSEFDAYRDSEADKSMYMQPLCAGALPDAWLRWPERNKQDHWAELADLIAAYAGAREWSLIADVSGPLIDEIQGEKHWTRDIVYIYKLYIFSLYTLRRSREALVACREVLWRCPCNSDVKMLEGDASFAVGDYRQALTSFETCQAWEISAKRHSRGARDVGLRRTSRKLAWSWLRLGDDLSALEWFLQAYQEDPTQAGVIPMTVLLTQDCKVLLEIERSLCDPDRYGEFVEYYAMRGFDDALRYVQYAEAKWGESEATKRARFVCGIREGTLRSSGTGKDDAFQAVRRGLWYYEQGEKDRAVSCWNDAGDSGDMLVQVSTALGGPHPWQIRGILKDCLASNAVQFLTDFCPSLTDCRDVMPVLLHTDLITAFTTAAYLDKSDVASCEEQEWKATVHLARGHSLRAEQALSQAILPDGYPTVRGYWLQAQLFADKRHQILQDACLCYPHSRFLSAWEQKASK